MTEGFHEYRDEMAKRMVLEATRSRVDLLGESTEQRAVALRCGSSKITRLAQHTGRRVSIMRLGRRNRGRGDFGAGAHGPGDCGVGGEASMNASRHRVPAPSPRANGVQLPTRLTPALLQARGTEFEPALASRQSRPCKSQAPAVSKSCRSPAPGSAGSRPGIVSEGQLRHALRSIPRPAHGPAAAQAQAARGTGAPGSPPPVTFFF